MTHTLRLTLAALALSVSHAALAQPAATDIPLIDGRWSVATAQVSSSIVWYRLTVPVAISAANNRAIDIDNEGSSLTPNNDTSLQLFNASGSLVGSDTSDGTAELAQLTFGRGTRTAAGFGATASFAYDGRDGTLNPGTYYLASIAGTALTTDNSFAPNLITSSSNGTLITRVRYYPTFGVTPTATLIPLTLQGNNWNSATGSITATTGAGSVAWFAFDLPTTDSTGSLDIDLTGTALAPINDASIAVYRPGGNFEDLDLNDGPGLLPALTYGWGGRFDTASGLRMNGRDGLLGGTIGLPVGRYYVAVIGDPITTDDVGNGYSIFPLAGSPNTGPVTLRVRYYNIGSPTLERPTGQVDLSPTPGGTWATASAPLGQTDVAWFRFTTPADLDTTGAVDIDTLGTSLAPLNDAKICIYDNGGIAGDFNNDSGHGLLPQLSFGAGDRAPVGDGEPFLGKDGGINVAGGINSSTTYWLAVNGGNDASNGSIFSSLPGPTSLNAGTATVRIRLWTSNAPSEPATPPAALDLGIIGPAIAGTEQVTTRSFPVATRADIQWLKFTISAAADDAAGTYLDIDTENTDVGGSRGVSSVHDTDVALFRGDGLFVRRDDDSGSDFRSQITFGSTIIRPAVEIPANITASLPRDGRNGPLAAGTYYVAVGTSATIFGRGQFFAEKTDTTPIPGTRVLNLRTNIPGSCGPSDVASANQAIGADGNLTADDIIVFLGWFFANDPRANVAGPNQSTTPDNVLTADDIIVFLGRYFTGC